jgi:hypothetical protein
MTNFQGTTYSISEAADKLSLSEKTLRRWEEAGRFTPSRTVGNQRRYSMQDLQILDAIKHNIIPHQNNLLTKVAAAQFLGVTEPTIDQLVSEGRLHPFTTVEATFYPRHRLLPLIENLEEKVASAAPKLPPTPVETPHPTPIPSPVAPYVKVAQIPKRFLTPILGQALITIVLILLYHVVFVRPAREPVIPTTTGSVQGVATTKTLALLEDMLDVGTGGLTATTVTSKLGTITPNLTLLPGVAPSTPLPGSLYYDAGTNTLKVYTDTGWHNLTTTTQLEQSLFSLESKLATPSADQ